MPFPINIAELLKGQIVEWERLEFKAGWNPEAVLHTICAFANDFHNLGGGYIFIGIGEKDGIPVLPPVGLQVNQLAAIQKEILQLGYNKITPAYHPVVEPVTVEGKHVLAVWVPGGDTRPYRAAVSLGRDEKTRAYYIRKGSSTVAARLDEERELLTLAAKVPFDDRINQRASLGDLNRLLIERFLLEIRSDMTENSKNMTLEEVCERMKIVGGPKESLFPRNVGLMFFNPKPVEFFPETRIDIVHFPEGEGGDHFMEKSFTGPLADMARNALEFIRNNLLVEHVVKRGDRAESDRFMNFPFAAVREALINAVYHRDYETREPIEVRITPEDMVILSYPGPDRSITLDQLERGKAVCRRYRNRRIGEFLKELDLTEGRATGIPKILRAMRENGSPRPQFETDEDRSYFLIRLPIHPDLELVRLETEPAAELDTEPAEDWELTVLNLCLIPRKSSEIQEVTGISHRATFFGRYLGRILEKGWLVRSIPDKLTSPNQRYSTTEKGRRILESHGRKDH
jgi:ATP-dependent DNA helicase RecG